MLVVMIPSSSNNDYAKAGINDKNRRFCKVISKLTHKLKMR